MLIDVELLPLKKKADEGDIKSQYKIAWAYLLGIGVPRDNLQGINYLKELVRHSHLELEGYNYEVLLIAIGSAYAEMGNNDEAIKWYKNALWFMVEYCADEYKSAQIEKFNLRHLIKTGDTPWRKNKAEIAD